MSSSCLLFYSIGREALLIVFTSGNVRNNERNVTGRPRTIKVANTIVLGKTIPAANFPHRDVPFRA